MIQDSGFRIQDSGFRIAVESILEFRLQIPEPWTLISEFRLQRPEPDPWNFKNKKSKIKKFKLLGSMGPQSIYRH